jgi:outer membrane PBP1 activator LpoA protein
MNRIPPKLYAQLPLAAVFLAGLVLVSCATMPPETPTSIRAAQEAIANAERVEAARYAAGELGAARTRLASAEAAVSEKKLILANQFADESRAEAELASAKTAEAKASAVNDEMKRSTGALVEEMKRGTGDKP